MRVLVTEDEFRRWFIDTLTHYSYHVSHIESHQTSAGIPDINAGKGSFDLWAELKIIKNGRVSMRPPQKKWHRDRYRYGGRSYVFVLDPKTQDVLWLRGHRAADLAPPEAAWRGASKIIPLTSLFVIFNQLTYGDNHV